MNSNGVLMLESTAIEQVFSALQTIRVNILRDEYKLQDIIARKLTSEGISYKREYRLGPRNRIDFLVDGGTGIEVKKGKPYTRHVVQQLERYTSFSQITSVILVVETSLDIPREINGKPCYSFGLNKLWGIAL